MVPQCRQARPGKSPKKACTGKMDRKPPGVVKPVMGTVTPSGARQAAIHSLARDDETDD